MATLTPVEGDPFAAKPPPAAPSAVAAPPGEAPGAFPGGVKLTPVEGDPFAQDAGGIDLSQVGPEANKFVAKAKAAMAKATGKELSVDYETGLSFSDKVAMDKLDNDDERRAYLTQRFGKDAIKQDPGGRFYVITPEGEKIAVTGGTMLGGFGAGMLSLGPEIIGGAAGAAMGAELGGPPGALIGAGLGTMLGKGTDEASKAFHGVLKKTPAEEIKALRNDALLGTIGEGVGRVGAAVIGRLTKGPIPDFLTGATRETKNMTALTLERGGVPPAKSWAPHLKVAAWHQMLSEKVVGPFSRMEAGNAKFLTAELKAALRESGVPPDQVDAALHEITNPTSRVSTKAVGESVQKAAQAYTATLEKTVADETGRVTAEIDSQLAHLNKLTQRYTPGDLGVDVAGGLKDARQAFGKMADKLYKKVDDLVGDKPIVPTQFLKKEAAKIAAKLPQSQQPGIFHEMADLPDRISLADAQRIRSRLREAADSGNLTPGSTNHDYGSLADTTDRAIGAAGRDPAAAPAIKLLRQADKFYGENIRKFGDAQVNQLVKQAQSGMAPDPMKVAAAIIRPGQTGKAVKIIEMLPPQVRQRVAAADFMNMVTDATADVGGVKVLTAKGLRRELERRGAALDAIYGKNTAGQIRRLADSLAARDGEIPPGLLAKGDLRAALETANAAQGKLDAFMGDRFLAGLANPNKMPDEILRWIVRPGHETAIEKAVTHFGESSPQVAGIRQMALRELLHRAIDQTDTGLGKGIAGGGIEKALAGFTERQQELLFPNGLADDIRLLAKEAKFLYPTLKDESMSGFAAGAILAMPIPVRWAAQLYAGAWGFVLSRPTVVRALALGLRGDGPMRAATRNTFKTLMRGEALEQAPDEGGEQPPPQ
jgi:hypothetical protein